MRRRGAGSQRDTPGFARGPPPPVQTSARSVSRLCQKTNTEKNVNFKVNHVNCKETYILQNY